MKLRLTIKAIRALQQRHGIDNLLQPTAADSTRMAHVDFLVDFYREGTRHMGPEAPTDEQIEEIDLEDVLAMVKGFMNGEPKEGEPGNG